MCMCNAYILYTEWFRATYPDQHKPKHVNFRLAVIKNLLERSDYVTVHFKSPILHDIARLSGRHFPQIIPTEAGKNNYVVNVLHAYQLRGKLIRENIPTRRRAGNESHI